MYFLWQLIMVIVLFISCNHIDNPEQTREKVAVDSNLQVTIEIAQSSKVELMKGVYTVFFVGKAPLEVKFELTPAEKEQIIKKYYSLVLYELKEVDPHWGTIYIKDECLIMPKIYTYLKVQRDRTRQRIQIDESCDEYKFGKSSKAERVKAFLEFVDKFIKAKPEIMKAPKSNIVYL